MEVSKATIDKPDDMLAAARNPEGQRGRPWFAATTLSVNVRRTPSPYKLYFDKISL